MGTGLTIEDFERLPAGLAEGYELVNGELVDVSGNTPRHTDLRDELNRLLRNYVRQHGLGNVLTEQEYDFEGNAHGPDVSFFSNEKKALLKWDKRVQPFVPDLAVEIESLRDTWSGLLQKKDRYLRCGTAEVWLIPRESREIYIYGEAVRVLGENDQLSTKLIPGFSVRVGDLFNY